MIPLFKVFMSPQAKELVGQVLDSGYIGQGSMVDKFERQLTQRLDAPVPLLALNSCTSALDLAMHLIGVAPGDEVITTPMTCLSYRAPISLSDGTTKPIGVIVNQRLPVTVLSLNEETGCMEPKHVTNWIRLPLDQSVWYRLSRWHAPGSKSPTGRSGAWITGDHKVMTLRGYVRVDELLDSDRIATDEKALNYRQLEVVAGTLLGNGYIQWGGLGRPRFAFNHTEGQKEWFDLKRWVVAGMPGCFWKKERHGASRAAWCYQSSAGSQWAVLASQWYATGLKRVPLDIVLTPLTLATWYMDDGCLVANTAVLSTEGFPEYDVRFLADRLCQMGILASARQKCGSSGYEIYIGNGNGGHDSARRFFELIAPYIPPSMRYKLPSDVQPIQFDPALWKLGDVEVFFDEPLVSRQDPPKHERPNWVYCLEVEDNHNFLCAGMVVSNCSATNVHIVHRGAKVVWADIDPVYGLIDPLDVARKITRQTKAIIAVDWAGKACDYDALKAHGIPVIQDAAHSFLARYKEKQIAQSGGDYVCWSFQAIKHLTTGDGGALLVPKAQYERAKLLRWYGLDRTQGESFRCSQDIGELGYKYHMNDIAAAIGLANLDGVVENLETHHNNAWEYSWKLKGLPAITVPESSKEPAWWLYTMHVPRRDEFIRYMALRGITASQVHARNDHHTSFAPPDRHLALSGVTEFCRCQVSIPVGWWVSPEDRRYIIKVIKDWKP